MSMVYRSEDGPKVVLTRRPQPFVELLSEVAEEDPDLWIIGAASVLHAHGWSYRQIGCALGGAPGNICRRVDDLEQKMRQTFAP